MSIKLFDKKKFKINNYYKIIVFSAFLISVAMTPWVNHDSLIIPKQIILVITAAYLVPVIFVNLGLNQSYKFYRITEGIVLVYLIQLVLTLLFSNSPWEQQVYGRTGRGQGILTEISLFIVLLSTVFFVNKIYLNFTLNAFIFASTISSIYSIIQFMGIDFFKWDTRTNGIIGTLGNPNFQSSFAAMAVVPILAKFSKNLSKNFISFVLLLISVYTVYICDSNQGYLIIFLSTFIFIICYFWIKIKKLFWISIGLFIFSLFMIILGMLNKGPLGEVLYKVSVESRIEMFRNSMRIALNNPFFGVGVDSLGDYYLLYKDAATVNGVNEFTDNAHNLYINYAATGGLLLALIQIILSIFCFISFFVIYKNVRHFDREIVSVFCLWCGYQAQSLISPTNISMMYWNMLFSGCLIGIARILLTKESINLQNKSKKDHYSRPVSYLLVLLIAAFMFPLFLVDKMQLDSAKLGDGNLAIKSATSYPESVVRYSRIGEALLNSKLNEAALGVARKATEFNPNAPSGWGLILVNNSAPYSERLQAKQKLIELDPTNIEVRNYIISLNNAIK